MYFVKSTTADVSTGGASDNTTPIAITNLCSKINVLEPEMWVKISVKALCSADTTNATRADLMAKIDTGTPVFLACQVSATAGDRAWVEGSTTVRLTTGNHTVAAYLRGSADTKVATVHGSVLPCVLEVLELSNNSVLAHGVDAKFQVTQ